MGRLARLMVYLIVCVCLSLSVHCCLADDDTHFVKQLQELASHDDGEAQLALALLYEHGDQGLGRDQEKALALFVQAAQAGMSAACLYLGIKYENGSGVAQNPKLATRWYCCAAKNGWAMAQFFLAACYEKGKGVEQDRMMALAWYGLAAEQGYPGAVEAINRLSGTMSENERKKAMAFRTRFQGTTVDCSRL